MGNTAVQVARKVHRKNKIVKHIGTARSPLEIVDLKERAQVYIDTQRIDSGIVSLFDSRYTQNKLEEILKKLRFTHAFDTVTYRFLKFFYQKIGFNRIGNDCFEDLVITRIAEPASKRKTRDILENRFRKKYSLSYIYRTLRMFIDRSYQEVIEKIVYVFVTSTLREVLNTLFFDVTTLYFEAFDEDDTRKYGFSKDGKHNQPQIVVALTITASGIPLSMRMFEGNTFEGHTMLPCVEETIQKLHLKEMIIVADSAMLSRDNLTLLESKHLKYIVGARLANLTNRMLKEVSVSIPRINGAHIRLLVEGSRILVVSYSELRAKKDKLDREKQIAKAKEMLKNPSKVSRRYKFLSSNKKAYRLNEVLIKKAEALEGLKGYISNAPELSDTDIMEKYASLWQVEKSFRMSKSDLKARPIFHTLKESIKAHLLIVFTALVISRYIEMVTKLSIQKVVSILSQIKEIIVEDPTSGQKASKLTNFTKEAQQLLKTVGAWVT